MIQKNILLGLKTYTYTLRRTVRSTRLRLTLSTDGALSVSAPIWVSHQFIEHFLAERKDWIETKLATVSSQPTGLIGRGGRREYLRYKEVARQLVLERLEYWNQQYGFPYGRITIRDQKTRWGSCSKRGNLSFNYRIALLPLELADYVILHELCHLGAFDHSARFWLLMKRVMPDYESRRKRLRRAV